MAKKQQTPNLNFQQSYQAPSVTQMFKLAVEHHRKGQLQPAEHICREILKIQHKHVDAMSLLGMIGLQCGHAHDAIKLLEKAHKYNPKSPDICNTLGMAYHYVGNIKGAIEIFNKAIKNNPEFAPGYLNLGISLQAKGDHDGSIKAFEKSLQYRPNHIDTLNNLGLVLHQQGRLNEAVEIFNKALAINPNAILILTNLSAVLISQKDFTKAKELLEKAILLKPDYADAQFNLGTLYQAESQLDKAQDAFEKTIKLKPNYAEAYNNLGLIYQRQGKLDEANTAYEKALEIKPEFAEALNNLGGLLKSTSSNIVVRNKQIKNAVDAFKKALQLNPGLSKTYSNIGDAFFEIDHDEEALSAFEHVLEMDKENLKARSKSATIFSRLGQFDEADQVAKGLSDGDIKGIGALHNLSMTRKFTTPDDELIKTMESILNKDEINEHQEMLLHFALGKTYDDCKLPDIAFPHFERANILKRKTIEYKKEENEEFFARLISFFNQDFFDQTNLEQNDSELPVFIVGMPRSGTTLVESIIASHPKVIGAGELTYLPKVINQLPELLQTNTQYPELLYELSSSQCREISTGYLEHVEVLLDSFEGFNRFTDKLPGNFVHLGVIAKLFPRAHIIHCQRDPIDTCLSIYTKNFKALHRYAFDQVELGHFYKQYERLMAHWYTVLPTPIYSVQYESLLAEQERISREMIDHIGLEWDDSCLAFHKAERSVATASLWQVRQPIYTSSKQRWKPYEPYLKPLIEALGAN